MIEWPATAQPASGAHGAYSAIRRGTTRDVIVMRSGSIEMIQYATGRKTLPHAPEHAKQRRRCAVEPTVSR